MQIVGGYVLGQKLSPANGIGLSFLDNLKMFQEASPGKQVAVFRQDSLRLHLHSVRGISQVLVLTDSKGKIVGGLASEQISNPKSFQVVGSMVLNRYRGKGYGLAMYRVALKRWASVSSDSHMTPAAVRVWEKLSDEEFTVKLYNTRLRAYVEYEFRDSIPWINDRNKMTPITKLKDAFIFVSEKN